MNTGTTCNLSSLPVVGRFLRRSERDWFDPQKQFTIMGGAEKLPLLAATFVGVLEGANYQSIKIHRASEFPINPKTACFRILDVSQTLLGHINAGCLSQVQLTADGPDLRVSVFSYPFCRMFLRDVLFAVLGFTLFVFVLPYVQVRFLFALPGVVNSVETRFLSLGLGLWYVWVQMIEGSKERLKTFRENRQAQLGFLRSAVEASLTKAVRNEVLGIKERDIIHHKQ